MVMQPTMVERYETCTFADANESATLTFSAANWIRLGPRHSWELRCTSFLILELNELSQLSVRIFDLRAMWNANEEAL